MPDERLSAHASLERSNGLDNGRNLTQMVFTNKKYCTFDGKIWPPNGIGLCMSDPDPFPFGQEPDLFI